jgi:ParB-like chromosome segregation protein Spo0J
LTVPTIKIDDLQDVHVDHLDQARVRDYAAHLDEFPPVVVFRTPQGLLLADGYHRVAAARLGGRDEITAEIREGTRSDALDFAVENAIGGAISRGAALRSIQRRLRP